MKNGLFIKTAVLLLGARLFASAPADDAYYVQDVAPNAAFVAMITEGDTGEAVVQEATDAAELDYVYADTVESVAEADVYYDVKADKDGKSCCTVGPTRSWIAGAEATFLVPSMSSMSGATVTVPGVNIVPAQTFATGLADMDNMAFSPRVWIGRQKGCWGIVGRFWQLENTQTTAAAPTFIAGQNFTFRADQQLEAYTIDLELTRRFNMGCWQMNLGLGGRYARVAAGAQAAATQSNVFAAPGFAAQSAADAYSTQDGFGFTMGLEGRRPILCRNLSLFWNVRGSILSGDTRGRYHTRNVAVHTTNAVVQDSAAIIQFDDQELFIAELQLGLQWEYQLKCAPAIAFFRVAGEYQFWNTDRFTGGLIGNADAGLGVQATSTAVTNDLDMNLIGFALSAGFTW